MRISEHSSLYEKKPIRKLVQRKAFLPGPRKCLILSAGATIRPTKRLPMALGQRGRWTKNYNCVVQGVTNVHQAGVAFGGLPPPNKAVSPLKIKYEALEIVILFCKFNVNLQNIKPP